MKSSRVSTHFPSGCFETCPSFRPPTTPRLPPLRQAQLLYCDIFPTLELFLCPSPFERISAVHGSKLLLPVVGSSEGFGQEVQVRSCLFQTLFYDMGVVWREILNALDDGGGFMRDWQKDKVAFRSISCLLNRDAILSLGHREPRLLLEPLSLRHLPLLRW